jgi:hypothetical protein
MSLDCNPLFLVGAVVEDETDGGGLPGPFKGHVHQALLIGTVVPGRHVAVTVCVLPRRLYLDVVHTAPTLEPGREQHSLHTAAS